MKKIISFIMTLCLVTSATPIFADEPFKELSNTFDIYEKNLASYEYIGQFNQEGYVLEEETISNYSMQMVDYNENQIVQGEYNYLELFYEDLAVAQKYSNSKYGFIDRNGNWAIAPTFQMADRFSDGLAYVYSNWQSGYIDKTGKLVHLLDEDENGTRFCNGIALIYSPDETRIINTKFETLSTFPNSSVWTSMWFEERFILWDYNQETGDSTTKVIDKDGKEYYSIINGNIDDFIDGKAIVSKENKTYLIDTMGNILAEKEIDSYSYFIRICDNINIESVYSNDDRNTLNVYDNEFKLIASYPDFYVALDIPSRSMLFTPEDSNNPHYFFINKTKREPVINENTYDTYFDFDKNISDTIIVLKIGDAKAYVNGEITYLEYDTSVDNYTAPFITNGRTMIPIRFISENFGSNNYIVDYLEFGGYQKVTITGENIIELVINDTLAKVTTFDTDLNDYKTKRVKLDVSPTIDNNRTFVPIRFVSETMGLNVEWDDRGYVIIGNKNLLENNLEELFDAKLNITNYPRIDGSTATIPISVAVTEKLLNISNTTANFMTTHTKTENAFNRLINNEVDLLFTGTPNKSKIEKAKDQGIELEYYPFAKDAFIFMVNKDNPVDTLTTDQLKKIYSGEITNWKEVGGNDEEIIAYQRNEDSGSQNLMKKFMGKTPLMTPKIDTVNAMGDMIDVIAEYDNNINAIGYTVNYYMSQMYYSDNVKAIKLDGIEPTDENIRTGKYPQVLEYAIVFNTNETEDSPVRSIVEFLKSEEGIQTIKDNNFVSIK